MITKQNLLDDIKNMGIKPSDTIVVHSSMKAIGDVEGGADTVLDALCEYVCDGLVILPTHTWGSMSEKHNVYDSDNEPSCVGLLSNIFMKRPGVVRSLHPTHSIAVFGKRAKAYIENEENCTTPCPRNGCWGRLYDEKSKILLIGVGFERNTFIHSVEEWFDVPERFTKHPTHFKIKMNDGTEKDSFMYRHYNRTCAHLSENFVKIESLCLERGVAKKHNFGKAQGWVCDTVALADLVERLLDENINVFTDLTPIEH